MNLGNSTLVMALASCAAFAAGTAFKSEATSTPTILEGISTGEATLAPILARATPAVVSIGVSGRMSSEGDQRGLDPRLRQLFGGWHSEPQEREFQASGSGVIVDGNGGYIVTNNHLVEHAEHIKVVLHDGKELDAELVGTDPDVDIAVVRVSGDSLTSIPLGDSEKLRVGDFVMAIGNPFGLSETATHGIVSALGRSGLGIAPRNGYENYIQTDAAINPGNSGGALINMKGELVGINTAIVGATGGNVGISFAIPVGMVRNIMTQLIDHGEVRRGRLGVEVRDLQADDARAQGEQGAMIMRVERGSAAEEAGLKNGDIILDVDGSAVRGSSDLHNKIGMRSIGDTVKVQYLRNGKKKTLEVRIADPSKGRSGLERA